MEILISKLEPEKKRENLKSTIRGKWLGCFISKNENKVLLGIGHWAWGIGHGA